MTKQIADLVDSAIPAAFGLLILAMPRALLKRGIPEHELEARMHKVRVIGGVLVTIGAAGVAMQLMR